MAELNPKELKERSRDLLAGTGWDHRRLILIYSGVLVALSLGSSALQLYLDQQISTTGGLSGLGLRSVLQTIQSVLGYVNVLFGPFWGAGLMSCIIALVRNQTPQPVKLLDGFKKWGRVLGYQMYQLLILMLLGYFAATFAGNLAMLTPPGKDFAAALEPLAADGSLITAAGTVNLEVIPTELAMQVAPYLVTIFAAIFLPLYVLISYHLRMTGYILMDAARISSMAAMLFSFKLMRGHKAQMLKLDLSFWWYYVLQALVALVAYLDVFLSAMGIALPFGGTAAYFITLLLYGVLTLVLDLWMKARVECTYVIAFEDIAHPDGVEIPE